MNLKKIFFDNYIFLLVITIVSIFIIISHNFNLFFINDLYNLLNTSNDYLNTTLSIVINVSGILAGFIFTGTTIFLSLENVYDFLKESGRLKYIFKNFIKTITHLTILIIYSLIIKFFSIDILILIVIGVSLYTLIELLSFLNIFGSAFEANSALDEEKEKNEKKQKEMEVEMDRQLREKENEK